MQGDVGILGGIFTHLFDPDQIHRQLLGSPTNERFDLDGVVVQVTFREGIHVMTRFGIEQIVQDHRIVEATSHLDTQLLQDHVVEFDILTHFGDRLVFKQGLEQGYIGLLGGGIKGNIPRLVRTNGDRKPHDLVVEGIEARRLRIEAKLRLAAHLLNHLAQRVERADQPIVMHDALCRIIARLIEQRRLSLRL